MANDQQNFMSGETLNADKAGNQAATEFGAVTSETPGQAWGTLPGLSIPLDHALQRQEFFRNEIVRTNTDGPDLPFMDDESIKGSYVLKTQKQMLENYIMDAAILPGADAAYTQFVPLANMAAKSIAKTDQVGYQLNITTKDQSKQFLDKAHLAALKTAVTNEKMDESQSVTLASHQVASGRQGMVRANHQLATVLNTQVISKLNKEIGEATEKKEEIKKKIEKAVKYVGYFEKAAGLVAGGAGVYADALEVAKEGVSLKMGAEYAEKGGGLVGSAVEGAMTLYYADQVRALDATIDAASTEISGWGHANEALQLSAAKAGVLEAAGNYKLAVDRYEAAINDRRVHMAAAGKSADELVAKKTHKKPGKDQLDSMALLWMESVMESKSVTDSAITAGNEAKDTLSSTSKKVSEHRSYHWAKIEDIWGSGGGAGRRESSADPDIHVLAKMMRLTDNWLSGAADMEKQLDASVGSTSSGTGESQTLADAGYSRKF